MIKWYTCYRCGFPFMAEDTMSDNTCPTCGASKELLLEEPVIEGAKRRIFVEAPKPDPDWDKMDTAYHCPKSFRTDSTDGRLRHFVLSYTQPKQLCEFYREIFDWDIVDTRVESPIHPLMYAATGPGSANWEPIAPSFIYGFLRAQRDDSTGKNPSYIIDVDNIEEKSRAITEYGGKMLWEPKKVGTVWIAAALDSEGNAFYLWHTPENSKWNYFDKDYTPAVFGRVPKKYPRKSLHGRVRGISIPYDDDVRMRRFYVNVFGWDMYTLPSYFYGEENTAYWAATGPTQATWEASIPGHITATMIPRHLSSKTYLWMEVDSCSEAVDLTVQHGGRLISGRLDGRDWNETVGESGGDWGNLAVVEDAQGNRILFWQCPGSRTWEEPEATHDMDFEE